MGSNIHWNAAPIDIPTNSAHVFHFIHILTDIFFVSLVLYHCERYKVVSHYSFKLYYSDD